MTRENFLEGCWGLLEDEAHSFLYVSHTDPKDQGIFHVGRDCAEQFYELLKVNPPPLAQTMSRSVSPSMSPMVN